MLTTSHMLIGAVATTRAHFRPLHIALGWLGGFAPDASVFLMVAVARLTPDMTPNLWRRPDGLYWQEPWQTLSAISNSMPVWALVAVLGLFLLWRVERLKVLGLGMLVFGGAAFIHVAADFLTHADDAHMHFWPVTDWRFNSPVSYYQRDHHGGIFRPFEMVLNVVLALYLILRFKQWPVRIMAVVFAAPPMLMWVLAPLLFR